MKLGFLAASVFLVLLAAVNVAGQTRADLSVAATVDFCDLVRHAQDYDQKIIRVKTFYIVGFEGSIFNKLDCHDKDVWVEFDPSVKMNTNSKVLKRFKRLANAAPVKTHGGGIDWPTRMVEVVAVGRFDGMRRKRKVANITLNEGYGHLGGFDLQFTVLAIEDVKALPTPKTTH
jgi:hypothetical protein